MVGSTCFPLAVQLLMRPESTLISDSEPVKRLIEVVRAGGLAAERISQTLFSPEVERIGEEQQKMVILTLSERKVLRLLAKGWGINQIAALLKKSNKTISAQKNSAMRRLSLRSNAEMYARLIVHRNEGAEYLFSLWRSKQNGKRLHNTIYRYRREMCDDGSGSSPHLT